MSSKIGPVGSSFVFVAADDRGNTVSANQGGGLLATGATGGFFYVPGMTGAPSSATGPTGYTGTVAHVFDVSNNMPWYLNAVNTFGGSTGSIPSWVAGNGQVLIQKIVLGGATGTITFNNIPQVFNHLRILGKVRSTRVAPNDDFMVRFNGDSTTNYDYQLMFGSGGSVSAFLGPATFIEICACASANTTANAGTQFVLDISAYTDTTFFKTTTSLGGVAAVAGSSYVMAVSGQWRNTTAVTSATLLFASGGNFVSGCSVYLYGIW